jgi:pyruvate/2-oxoglutarate dehydrogenase complex dihydrolipoamide acyltransferase (E2) component
VKKKEQKNKVKNKKMEEFKDTVTEVLGNDIPVLKIEELYERLHMMFFNSTQNFSNNENLILYKKLKNIENMISTKNNEKTVKTKTKKTDSVFASKSTEQYATENNIDIKNITATGKNGKILKKDIKKAIDKKTNKKRCKGYYVSGLMCRKHALETGYCRHHNVEHLQEEKQKQKQKQKENIIDDNSEYGIDNDSWNNLLLT